MKKLSKKVSTSNAMVSDIDSDIELKLNENQT